MMAGCSAIEFNLVRMEGIAGEVALYDKGLCLVKMGAYRKAVHMYGT